MPREVFRAILRKHAWEANRVGRWAVDPALNVADWRPAAASKAA
jgi:hypothetical protein